jgi:hypothetical protein
VDENVIRRSRKLVEIFNQGAGDYAVLRFALRQRQDYVFTFPYDDMVNVLWQCTGRHRGVRAADGDTPPPQTLLAEPLKTLAHP